MDRAKPAGSRQSLLLSTAVAALVCVALCARPASAQSVSGTGALTPGAVQSPVWTIGAPLIVGDGSDGTLSIAGGGSVDNDSGTIGSDATGAVTVSGTDGSGNASTWANDGDLAIGVGASGRGTLGIDGGGVVNVTGVGFVGLDVGSQGDVTVSGQDGNGDASTWAIGGDLVIGQDGTGTLSIMDGALVSNETGYIGADAGSQGTVIVSGRGTNGTGATWINRGDLRVGDAGSGELTIQDGGLVRVGGDLSIGNDGAGILNITSGGKAVSTSGGIGGNSGDGGRVLITGAGSSWEASGRITVGLFGIGSLRIEDGATVSSGDGVVGSSARGDVVVSGSASAWSNAGQLTVGSFATGTLRIEDGASVTSNQGYIGANADGSAVVTGAGSNWWVTDYTMTIGNLGAGTLTIEDGGRVRAEGGFSLGVTGGSSGTLILQGTAANRAILETSQIGAGLGTVNLTIDGGVLRATEDTDDFFVDFDAHNITLGTNGGVIDTDGHDIGISPRFVGAGNLIKDGIGTLTLTGDNSYGGGTTINAGTLQLGDGGTSGSIVGNVTNDGLLAFNRSNTLTFAGTITGAGGVVQQGPGTTVLTADNSYRGATTVMAGSLFVNGDQSGATGLTSVAAGSTLGGRGVIGGNVALADDATLDPGGIDGAPGTLTINGNLSLSSGSKLSMQFGQANIVGGPFNDLASVGGNLILDGTLNVGVPSGGTFGPGVYRVFDYGGMLTDNGLALGTMPSGSTVFVQTSIAGQVNLVNTGGLALNFWDGDAGPKFNQAVNGGNGVWQNGTGNTNWTDANGALNAVYADGAFAIFQGAGGTVTVDDGLGTVRTSGMQFAVDGYTITGAPLDLIGTQAIIRVGGGAATDAGLTATLAANLTGSAQLVKTDAGTLILRGSNSYAGGTAINGGTLRISADANLGATSGPLSFDGGTLDTTANLTSDRTVTFMGAGTVATEAGTTFMLTGSLFGSGAFAKTGAGTLVFTGDGSGYSGAAKVDAGTLAINGLMRGNMAVNAAGRLVGTGQAGTLTNSGVVAPGFEGAMGTLTVQGDYVGNGGRLEIVAVLGGDNSPTSRLVVNGATSGATQVDVINRGGLGGQTAEGIKIVDVAGASSGRFVLNGDYVFHGDPAVIAGAYGYRLYQGGTVNPADGDWYLRSALIDPGQTDGGGNSGQTPLYQPGVPVYEGYVANLQSLNTLPTLQQRIGNRSWAAGAGPEGSGIWGRMEGTLDRANAAFSTSGADQDINSWKAQLGVDRVLAGTDQGERLVAGITASYGTADSQIDSAFGNGTIKTSGYGAGVTLTWYGRTGFYLDGQAQIGRYSSTLRSGILGMLTRDHDGRGEAFSVEAGKRMSIGGMLSITPQVQMVYSHVAFDRFTDAAGAIVAADKGDSLKTRWGISLDHQGMRENGRSHVYGLVNVNYEWLGGASVLVSDTPIYRADERLWGELGLGASMGWATGLTLYGEVSGSSPFRNFGQSYMLRGNVGLRIQF
ncbi:autotransporter outer membrane beta-barrel domain-containing protein [Sphingomonas sp. KC8]|uniref:autotransporter outer membrane beta-barrel domain-containing protein n=1 Tax=Sphingomonas sp. KC8 TaxID=1030157 RepID=UPI0002489BDA|nr:autotransporter outer membrane beta-barrel domain-containing protein [Sphingomonas sp. KC8]ARS29523.1 hypothetical protein KC8_19845 [Sphingomonas sp. KC8]